MTITVDFDENVSLALQKTATANGETPEEFVREAVQRSLPIGHDLTADRDVERLKRLDAAIAAISAGNSSLGREGRPWRELIHEGHKY
jgi:hypothetical protein